MYYPSDGGKGLTCYSIFCFGPSKGRRIVESDGLALYLYQGVHGVFGFDDKRALGCPFAHVSVFFFLVVFYHKFEAAVFVKQAVAALFFTILVVLNFSDLAAGIKKYGAAGLFIILKPSFCFYAPVWKIVGHFSFFFAVYFLKSARNHACTIFFNPFFRLLRIPLLAGITAKAEYKQDQRWVNATVVLGMRFHLLEY